MQKSVVKIFIAIGIICIMFVIGAVCFLGNMDKKNIVKDTIFSIKNTDILTTTEAEASGTVNSNFTNEKIKGSTVWPIVDVTKYTYKNKEKTASKGTLPALTECLVIDASLENERFKVKYVTNGKAWTDSSAKFEECWVNARRMLINLPDICDNIQYDIKNAYKSIFKIGSKSRGDVVAIDGLTDRQLYTYDNYDGKVDGKVYNPKLNRNEFVCPVIFPFAEEVAKAEKNAEAKGYYLKIYDGYRPQEDVCDKFWNSTYNAMNSSTSAYNLINKNGWTLGWFVANPSNGRSSDHARGTAIDVTLVSQTDGKEISTKSDMHDLSTNSVKTLNPGTNYNVTPTVNYTEGTMTLHKIMVEDSALGGLPSEWWHYNIPRDNTEFNNYVGKKNITYTNKIEFIAEDVRFSPATKIVTNKRTASITANKEIKAVTSEQGKIWKISSDKKTVSCEYTENIQDKVTIKDSNGNSITKNVNVKNIDNKVDITSAPQYSPNVATNGNVKVYINANEELKSVNGGTGNWQIDGNCAIGTYSNNTNGNQTITVEDLYGNIKEITVNVNNIDKTAPTISTQQCIMENKVWILIRANEEIQNAGSENQTNAYYLNKGTAKDVMNGYITDMKAYNSEITVDNNNMNMYAILNYDSNYNSETITIKDKAGNSTNKTIEISGIDDKGPTLTIKYNDGINTYNDNNYSTNKDVTVTIKADEQIQPIDGWTLSNDNTILTKHYDAPRKETIEVKDKYNNVTASKIFVKIDKQAPSITSPKEEVISNSESIRLEIYFDEPVIPTDNSWRINNTVSIIKDYTTDEEEIVTVNDKAGNEFNFKVIVTKEGNKLIAKVTDTVSPILEKIQYGTKEPTYYNVNVELIINEKVNEVENWNLKEGTGTYEGKWILSRMYESNVDNDEVEITDIDSNKIVGNSDTEDYVQDGKVKISVTNIDRESPVITLNSASQTDDNIILNVNEPIYSVKSVNNTNWTIDNENNSAKIKGNIQKGTSEILKVLDIARNATWIEVTKDESGQVVVNKGSYLESLTYSHPKQVTKVTAQIKISNKVGKVNNKQIETGETIDGWTLREGVGTQAGKSILEKVYTSNVESEEVLIEDLEGNKIIGENVHNGIVTISINNIDSTLPQKNTSSIEIENSPTKTIYCRGEILDLTGLKLNVKYDDETQDTVEYENGNSNGIEVSLYGSDKSNVIMLSQVGQQQRVIVYFENQTTWFYITVNEVPTVQNIKIKSLPSTLKYNIGDTLSTDGLSLTVEYSDDTSQDITEGYNVEPITLDSAGKKTINVIYEGKTASFDVHVSDSNSSLQSIKIKEWPDKDYIEGQIIDTDGIKITAEYYDGKILDVTDGFTIEPTTVLKKGKQIVTITYEGKQIEKIITVSKKQITNLELVKLPNTTTYNLGISVDLTGIQLKASYNNGSEETIDNINNLICEPEVLTEPGNNKVTVSLKGYETKQVEIDVTVKDVDVKKIEVKPDVTKTYYKGDKININYLEVIATFTDESTDLITTGFTIEPEVLENEGLQEVLVTYKGKTTLVSINVKDATIQSIRIKDEPQKKSFVIGELLNKEDFVGLVVEAQYSDGSTQNINLDELEIEDTVFSEEGTKLIKVICKGKETSFEVNVRKLKFQIVGIGKQPNTLEYYKGDKLDVTGLELYVIDEYGDIKTINPTLYNEITFSPIELNTVGIQKIKVQNGNNEDYITFDVTVKEKQEGKNTDSNNEQNDNNNSNKEDNSNKAENNQGDTNQNNSNEDGIEQNNSSQNSKDNINNNNQNDKKKQNGSNSTNSNGNNNETEENISQQNNYKDANTAKTRLPQTGTQISVFMIVLGVVILLSTSICCGLYVGYNKSK